MSKKDAVPNRQYTREFKVEAVRLAESVGGNEAAKRLGIPDSSLWNWVRLHRAGKLEGKSGTLAPVKRAASELEAENARLRRELANTKLDLEIVKNVWSAPDLQASIPSEQNDVCVNVSGLLVQHVAAGLDGISAHRAP